ncbi:MAG: precorrin-8X methylmutase [Anaerolineae bacterium]|nr:precorrin-8X methylmutase [Anaerolineae bacterium]MDW8072492.1 precorrin-8X methylmutase [Anaerolineae bacterium]
MLPHEIERESFRLIEAQLEKGRFSPQEYAVALRVVHATADFAFADALRFHPQAISCGIEALQRGCTIVTDVRMVQVGIASALLERVRGRTFCAIGDPQVAELAQRYGITRAVAAMRHSVPHMQCGVVAVGNAPTALFEVIRLVREEAVRPALIIGTPVGFVKAAESKEALLTLEVPYITVLGNKGGSSVAVAIVNALLRMAVQGKEPR